MDNTKNRSLYDPFTTHLRGSRLVDAPSGRSFIDLYSFYASPHLRHIGLAKENGFFRVKTAGEKIQRNIERIFPAFVRIKDAKSSNDNWR